MDCTNWASYTRVLTQVSNYTLCLTVPLPQIHTLKHQKTQFPHVHITVLFMCLEFEWESLGWIATHPNPLSNNVCCGEGIHLFSVFMFLAIVIALRLSYIGAELWIRVLFGETQQQVPEVFSFPELFSTSFFVTLHTSISVQLPGASHVLSGTYLDN